MPRSDRKFPSQGRLAGIDYGQVNVGIAITDVEQRIASPYENYARRTDALDARHFASFVEQESVVGFVVGLPIHASGEESQKSSEARAYGKWLGDTTGLPVRYFDERFTTRVAEALMRESGMKRKRRSGRRDMIAAQVMLSGYIESVAPTEPPQPLE